jgi:hypothetical protein
VAPATFRTDVRILLSASQALPSARDESGN